MTKRILSLGIMLMAATMMATGLFAQSTKERIKQIKRSNEYFSAESTVATEAEGREASLVLLANFINDFREDNGIPGENVKSTDLKDAQFIKENRGDWVYVLAYVRRDAYIPGYTAQSLPSKQEQPTVTYEEEPAPAPAKPSVPAKPSTPAPSQQPAAGSATIAAGSPSDLTSTQREALNELYAKGSLLKAMRYMASLRAENIVKRFGTIKECRNAAGSFWVIADNDANMSIIAILGPGSADRFNFVTGSYDSLGNYSGYNAMWFQFY